MEKNLISEIIDLGKIVIIALIIVIPIRFFVFQPFMVSGASMEPNYHSTDYLIIDELSYRFSAPQRGDVIVFKYPKNPNLKYIKRIIGYPGETIEIRNTEVIITTTDNTTVVLNENYLPEDTISSWVRGANYGPITLKNNEYFVLGDNRNYSADSRSWGVLPKDNIIGKVAFIFSVTDLLNKKTETDKESY
ncbi:MAG: signal peptidase I [Candidatus Pacebacteria bacterium]|nr:signal peptidase I [Candidatus Paceibacterota bacterium]